VDCGWIFIGECGRCRVLFESVPWAWWMEEGVTAFVLCRVRSGFVLGGGAALVV